MSNPLPIAFLDGVTGFLQASAAEQGILHSFLLVFAIAVPLTLAVALAVSGKLPDPVVRGASILGFLVPAVVSLWLGAVYVASVHDGTYAFVILADLGLEQFGIRLHLGLNGLSLPFYILAGVVGLAAGLYALQSGVANLRLYMVLLLVMQAGLMGVFSSIDILFFYLFHEFALIPTFILIAMYGRQGRRSVAIELTIYLTLGAMITLAGLIAIYLFSGLETFNMIALRGALSGAPEGGLIFGLLLIGFGILVSLFPFHSWAPRGYATAPAPVAMLHAGVLKKFGLYGLIQIAYPVLPEAAGQWLPLLVWLALGNLILIGFVTMAQRDLKLMLGNASVMHMGYAFLGFATLSALGVGATILMLFAHGLSVALLFLLADVIEKRTGTADMPSMGGLAQKAPVLMALFVAATMASIGLPGFANFWGELGIFLSLWASPFSWVVFVAVAGIIISAIYGLRAVGRIFFGEPDAALPAETADIQSSEKFPALLLLAFLFLLGFWPRLLSDTADASVTRLYSDPVPAVEIPLIVAEPGE
jgi:NADH-quinone oxidoreductase subunit M